MSYLVKSFLLDSLNSIDSCITLVSQQGWAFFSCFSLCPNSWLQRYSWISMVFTRVAQCDQGTFCNIQQCILRLNLGISIYLGLTFMKHDTESLA